MVNLPDDLHVPLIIDHHNVEYRLFERYARFPESAARGLYARIEAQLMRRWEAAACARASVILACSENDKKDFEALDPDRPAVVAPNVVDVHTYPICVEPPQEQIVLYAGGMDWYPNRDAVQYFAKQMLPLVRERVANVKFVVAGRSPSTEFLQSIRGVGDVSFTGTVPDMRAEIARASVVVVPLRIGSGTRLKILEACAMAKPVVSTSVGAEGLSFHHGSEIIIADDPIVFANRVADLLQDVESARQLGLSARRNVERNYSLDNMRIALRTAFAHLGRPAPAKTQALRATEAGA